MKITFTTDCRCFKAGDVYELNLQPGEITFLIGPNGCGKSTLMFTMRHEMDSLSEMDDKNFEGMKKYSLMEHYVDIAGSVKVEEFDFKHAFFRDTVADDPTSFNNIATALSLINGGGMGLHNKSAGQKNIYKFIRFVAEISKVLGEHSDERVLIGIDELDDSLDLKTQMRQAQIMHDILFKRFPNASLIFITHSIFTVAGADNWEGINSRCFDVKRNKYTTYKEYFENETGYSIDVTKISENE